MMVTAKAARTASKNQEASASRLIARRFGRSAASYDDNACVQTRAVSFAESRLAEVIHDLPNGPILEIGCGTGMFSIRLASLAQSVPAATPIVFTDPAQPMLNACRARLEKTSGEAHQTADYRFECRSAEELAQANEPLKFALIASSFALQWVTNLEQMVENLLDMLVPGGAFLFCVPTDQSFPEWKKACLDNEIPFTGNHLPTVDDFLGYDSSLYSVDFCQTECVVFHDSALDFFRTLRLTGATARLDAEKTKSDEHSAQRLRTLLKAWKPDRDGQIQVTYRLLCGIIRKPS